MDSVYCYHQSSETRVTGVQNIMISIWKHDHDESSERPACSIIVLGSAPDKAAVAVTGKDSPDSLQGSNSTSIEVQTGVTVQGIIMLIPMLFSCGKSTIHVSFVLYYFSLLLSWDLWSRKSKTER